MRESLGRVAHWFPATLFIAVTLFVLSAADPITAAYGYLRSVAFVQGPPDVVVLVVFGLLLIVAAALAWKVRPMALDALLLLVIAVPSAQLAIALLYVFIGSVRLPASCAVSVDEIRVAHAVLLLGVLFSCAWMTKFPRQLVAWCQISILLVSLVGAWNLVGVVRAGCMGLRFGAGGAIVTFV